ncbi:hypothetical protein DM82_3513 [Burkholderia oklahomensis]|uniref:Uncharacterized protein n=1 Tax=Burkholderia oklahomensis TaxID=342113 RepID=A0AAI8B292_9BURK|nr:hypothetical protein DM82_3513 [Burkholderia oklahomensis]
MRQVSRAPRVGRRLGGSEPEAALSARVEPGWRGALGEEAEGPGRAWRAFGGASERAGNSLAAHRSGLGTAWRGARSGFEAGSERIRSEFGAGSERVRSGFEAGSKRVRSGFGADSKLVCSAVQRRFSRPGRRHGCGRLTLGRPASRAAGHANRIPSSVEKRGRASAGHRAWAGSDNCRSGHETRSGGAEWPAPAPAAAAKPPNRQSPEVASLKSDRISEQRAAHLSINVRRRHRPDAGCRCDRVSRVACHASSGSFCRSVTNSSAAVG